MGVERSQLRRTMTLLKNHMVDQFKFASGRPLRGLKMKGFPFSKLKSRGINDHIISLDNIYHRSDI